jgi:type I restriction enzyme R subunit
MVMTMAAKHNEAAFETEIVDQMVASGDWMEGKNTSYDADLCLYPEALIQFVQTTQLEEWEKLKRAVGADARATFLRHVANEITLRGTLAVLRNDVDLYGCRFRLVYFQPSSSRNPELEEQFKRNVLTVVRQVFYSTTNRNSIDLALFINGIPVFTSELKNELTGQDVHDAVRQYRYDRRPEGEPFLKFGRCLAHFAVDTKLVQVTTRLTGQSTYFIPFNRGRDGGAGNPAPPAIGGGYATDYLWLKVWSKVSVLDILQHFLHHEKVGMRRSKSLGKLIFPRYHQLEAVRSLIKEAESEGAGGNYLVQHSAGSGKSNTIAWLSHRLSQLMDDEDERVFNAIIVISDRKVLDKQLRETVRAYEKTQGLVAAIDGTSAQLKEALEKGKQIIVTTLHKFPVIVDEIGKLPGQRFALLIDEAHSSQGGSMAQATVKVLTSDGEEEEERDYEDIIHDEIAARGKQKNISVFAFTATPKSKTLELFGRKLPDNRFAAHSLYSMRQAIEEGFILDVLQNYTTYSTYWKLNKSEPDDPEVEASKAKAILRRFVLEHPETIRQKVDVIMNHFCNNSVGRINGQAKAMLVTSSRANAVKYRLAVDAWLKENPHPFKALVAFTDTITIDGKDYTEANMNGFGDGQTAKKFDEDEYRLLIVANKYQTGFDQPLLHSMYVDKKLGGVNAVQTLSRLNRVAPGKEETFVLDFANDPEAIQSAFQDYYTATYLEHPSDPMAVYQLRREILDCDVFTEADAEAFCRILFDDKKGHPELVAFLSRKVEHFVETLDDEAEKAEYRKMLRAFYRGYGFLARVMTFQDAKLEEFYHFSRHIARLLPVQGVEMPMYVEDMVEYDSLRLSQKSDGSIALVNKQAELPSRGVESITGVGDDELEPLSAIIEMLNATYGANLTDEDRLFIGTLLDTLHADKNLETVFKVNPPENVKTVFADRLTESMIEKVNTHKAFADRFFNDDHFQKDVIAIMMDQVQKGFDLSDEKRILQMIAQGESTTMEFKSSLRYNRREGKKKDKVIEHEVVKTVCAFLNSRFGGHLLIGVDDDGNVLGTEDDGFENDDKLLRHLVNILRRDIGRVFVPQCDMRAVQVEEKSVVWVHVKPSLFGPAWCGSGDDKIFYVREGASSPRYNDEEALQYIAGVFVDHDDEE